MLGWEFPPYFAGGVGVVGQQLSCALTERGHEITFLMPSGPEGLDGGPVRLVAASHHVSGEVVNLFMDYETFGEHQWSETGVFEFMRHLPDELLRHPDTDFKTPSEVVSCYDPVAELDIPEFVSWADTDRDLTAWLGNPLQEVAARAIYELGPAVRARGSAEQLRSWQRLTTSDHLYYLCTKWSADGDVHKYFSPYESPYEAYIYLMNVLNDLGQRLGVPEASGIGSGVVAMRSREQRASA